MPRTRGYASNAERQAAYRARHADREPPRQGYLASQARTLHLVLGDAVRAGRSPWPEDLLGTRADDTLHRLICYVRSHWEGDCEGR